MGPSEKCVTGYHRYSSALTPAPGSAQRNTFVQWYQGGVMVRLVPGDASHTATHPHLRPSQQDVVRLHVPVDVSLSVHVREPRGDVL